MCRPLESKGKGKGRNQTRLDNKSRIQCYYCRRFGNYESECKKNQVEPIKVSANVIKQGNSKTMLFSCQSIEECERMDLWLLDSACSNHMTSNKSLFSRLDVSVKTKVKLGDGYLVDDQGKGSVCSF